MLKISLAQLKQLQPRSSRSLAETEAVKSPVSYGAFLAAYKKTISSVDLEDTDRYASAYKLILDGWIKEHCPPIKFIGQGSSRGAFAMEGGNCLKIAINEMGINQNKTEYQNTTSKTIEEYPVFAQSYDKADDNSSILTECCASITEAEWGAMWSIKDKEFITNPESYLIPAATAFYDNGCSWSKAIAILKSEDQEKQANFAQAVSEAKTPAMKTLKSLFKFYADDKSHWEKLMVFDLCTVQNWGAAIRFGQAVPVILDAGFSSGTFGGLDLSQFGI